MHPEKKAGKRLQKKNANVLGKAIREARRHREMVELGKTVIVTEKDGVKSYAFPPKQKEPPSIPSLAWLSGKTYRHPDPRKNRSGRKPEHTEALAENASRILAVEIDKARELPSVDGTPVIIGEFADHDKVQGAAIDNSIATGEGLFA